MSILRPYQEQAIAAFETSSIVGKAIDEENVRLAIQLATGLGKTVTGAHLAAKTGSALILTHTEEITSQWVGKLKFAARNTGFSVGVVKANRDEPSADLVVASIPTLLNPARRKPIGRRNIIIFDECHHATAESRSMVLREFGAWDGVPTLGLTATLARSDRVGLGKVWQDLVFSRGITWAQRHGYLLDVIPWRVRVPDVDSMSTDAALDAMLADSIAPDVVVKAWQEHATGRSTVLFAPLIKSAQAFADAFLAAGIPAEVIHGDSPDREKILARYESGKTMVLCNAMVLTEGWDSPRTMCVIWARKVGGPLFIQGVGRGLRPWIAAEAPPREDQHCVLICVTDIDEASLDGIADLSDRSLDGVADGKSMMEAADEFDFADDLEEEYPIHYRGPVQVERWDLTVQASTKAWKFTKAGAPFLPTAKSSRGYVFVVGSTVYLYGEHPAIRGKWGARRVAVAPDPSLAMALAEDEAHEHGGDIGALLADKSRPWRKAVPSMDVVRTALRVGVSQTEIDRILGQRAAGKAGKLSDLIDKMQASRVLDPIVERIIK